MPRITLVEDIERMEERIDDLFETLIQDRDSFDTAFSDILDNQPLNAKQEAFRDDVFQLYLNNHPDVRPDRLFKKARGKDLRRDRKKTAKKIVTTDAAFIKAGSKKVDFAGFDVRESEITPAAVRARKEFKIPGFVKNQIVFVRKTFIEVRGKRKVIYRDNKGRFGSIK